MNAQAKIHKLIDSLVAEGDAVLNSRYPDTRNFLGPPPEYVDLGLFSIWRARCKLLATVLGHVGKPWESHLTADWPNGIEFAILTKSTLKAIQISADEGLLLEVEDLVLADVFANLCEQAEYLLSNRFFLAAGVVFRAVLEERLRRLCEQHSITLGKTKPTLNDYNSELYKSSVYDKITFKEVDTLIAIGNDAAHNNPTLVIERISLMRDGVTRILQKLST